MWVSATNINEQTNKYPRMTQQDMPGQKHKFFLTKESLFLQWCLSKYMLNGYETAMLISRAGCDAWESNFI
jgi:hypothetical protein